MISRTIRLISNTYNAKKNAVFKPLGEYCVFGPYDAMEIDEKAREWKNDQTLDSMSEKEIMLFDGKRQQCNIICAAPSACMQSEAEFAARMRNKPFLFVSLLMLDRSLMNKEEVVKKATEINQEETCRIYLSSGKNELVILHYCSSFRNGLSTILEKHNIIPAILKTSTMFAVLEKSFDPSHLLYNQIEDEKVSCRLRCFVRDRSKANCFLLELGKDIMDRGAEGMRWFNILGSTDLLAEIDSVPLKVLLSYYRTGEKLTHMNQQYNEAWYNIETEFISDNGGMDYGAVYKQCGGDGQAISKVCGSESTGIAADVCSETSK